MKKLHLVCNAHIDPVWQWTLDEGIAAAVGTYRIATDLSEEFEYVFCHNEAMVYEWIKKFDPDNYNRIKTLIKKGKWKIIGGWYLQPDCNMPSGEAITRQILVGNEFFKKEFGIEIETAVNFDSFGHSVGFPQILKKCGYKNYLCCRPYPFESDIKDDDFIWESPDGSKVVAHRNSHAYASTLGYAVDKIKNYLSDKKDKEMGMVLWGTGNHGGGASRKDLCEINCFMKESDIEIVHSTPDGYFLDNDFSKCKILKKSIGECMQGCYTSQHKIKKMYREVENLYFLTEKICMQADVAMLKAYPVEKLQEAQKTMLLLQFHDILPGTSVKRAVEQIIELGGYAKKILRDLCFESFFSFANTLKEVEEGSYPIVVYNPHPYNYEGLIQGEFMLSALDTDEKNVIDVDVYCDNLKIASQIVKEESNININWRKKVAFWANVPPASVKRYNCKIKKLPRFEYDLDVSDFKYKNHCYEAEIKNGFLSIKKNGVCFIENAFAIGLYRDNEDAWSMGKAFRQGFKEKIGEFRLMNKKEATYFCGADKEVFATRIIEKGKILTKIECLLQCNNSRAVLTYTFVDKSEDVLVDLKLLFLENNAIAKIEVPTNVCNGEFITQTCFAEETHKKDGREVPMQKYARLVGNNGFVNIVNDGIYGVSCEESILKFSLARGAVYCGHPIDEREIVVQDRYHQRVDCGIEEYSFLLSCGNNIDSRAEEIKAQIFNEPPFSVHFFSHGNGEPVKMNYRLTGNIELVSARKKEETYVFRVFNQSREKTTGEFSFYNFKKQITLGAFEVKSIVVDGDNIKIEDKIL